ncbi:MAG: bacteriohemerythrin [Bacteroidota bacterium]|jgi:hemerythrin-like metal-binding protein
MALTWTEVYSVGVKEFDDHHRQLFSLLNNNLKSVIENNGQSKTIAADLKKLQEYAVTHFKAEENLFLKINYPDARAHIHEHEEFRKELQKLDTLADGTDDLARLKLLLFLSTWFTKHIMTVDKKYIPYLKEK